MKMLEYALYKGDQLLGIGTVECLSKKLGLNKKTLHYYHTPTYKKRTSEKKGKRLIKIDE